MQRADATMGREDVEVAGARDVRHDAIVAGRDRGGDAGDGVVGHAEDDERASPIARTSSWWTYFDVVAHPTQGDGEGRARTTGSRRLRSSSLLLSVPAPRGCRSVISATTRVYRVARPPRRQRPTGPASPTPGPTRAGGPGRRSVRTSAGAVRASPGRRCARRRRAVRRRRACAVPMRTSRTRSRAASARWARSSSSRGVASVIEFHDQVPVVVLHHATDGTRLVDRRDAVRVTLGDEVDARDEVGTTITEVRSQREIGGAH